MQIEQNKQNEYFVGIDPGLGGGLAIISCEQGTVVDAKVYHIPLIKTKATKTSKAKNEYNVQEIAVMLKPLSSVKSRVKVCLEKIGAMPGQGSVSMFHFGEGFGIWKGIIGTLGFDLHLVTPLTWKKMWPENLLKNTVKPDMLKLKPVEVNRLSASDRKIHKELSKEYKKSQSAAKKLAKDHARELAGILYPNLADCFLLKKDDGKAEALLMAEYLRRVNNGT